MESPTACADYRGRGFDRKDTQMNADGGTTLMTLTALQIITIGDPIPTSPKWNFTVGAFGGTTVSAIGYLLYQWLF